LGNEDGIEALEVLLKDEATTVRGEAVEALAHIGTLRAAEVLAATLSYEPVKAQIQVQLANMGQLATRALLRTARAAEPELRAVAAEMLGHLRSTPALPTLRLLLRDPDTRVRRAAEKALKMVEAS
jgi:HEAT repeat protein